MHSLSIDSRNLLLALTVAVCCLPACSSSEPAGYGATCAEVSECGGETPLCSEGACVACAGNADCRSDDPVCNDDGLCAECAADADCPAGEPFCVSDGRCGECRSNEDCGVAQPICTPRGHCEPACTDSATCEDNELCHPTLGACTECADDNDCFGREDGPLCDPDTLRCVNCINSEDCGVASPFCIGGRCEECIQNTDCGAGYVCDDDLECRRSCESDLQCTDGDRGHCIVETGACVECELDAHCTFDEDQPVCIVNQCKECRTSEDCPSDNPICNLENNECVGG